MTREFKGVVPPIITPFTSESEVNEDAYRQVLEFNLKAGVHGFWVCGAAGEGLLLSDDERMRIAEVSVDQVRGRAKVIMHVGATTVRSAVRLALQACAAGVDAVSAVPPLHYRPGDDGIVAYYRAIAEAVDLPLFVYNYPAMTGVEVTPPLMEKLVREIPQMAGVKHSAPNFFNIYAFNRLGIAVFAGPLLPALTMGAVGCIASPSNIAPGIYLDIYNAYLEGNLAKAEERQRQAAAIQAFCFQFPYIALYKTVLSERLGIECGVPRPPIRSLTEDQSREVIRRTKELGIV